MTKRRSYHALLCACLIPFAAACGDADDTDPAFVEDSLQADTAASERPAQGGFPAPADSSRPAGTLGDPSEGAQIVADVKEWTVTLSEETVDLGQVTVAVRNTGTIPHAIEIAGEHGGRWRSLPVAPGSTVEMSMLLSNGTYRVFCPLDDEAGDHSERGMQTTLVVR